MADEAIHSSYQGRSELPYLHHDRAAAPPACSPATMPAIGGPRVAPDLLRHPVPCRPNPVNVLDLGPHL